MPDEYKSRTEKRSQQKKRPARSPKKPKAEQTKSSQRRSVAKRLFLGVFLLGLLVLLGGAGLFAYYVKDTPKLDESLLTDPLSSKITYNNGTLLTNIGAERRDYVAYDDVPVLVRDAFIATEDSRFFEHKGIDPVRLGGAVIKNVTDGFGSQGASTITQQVVKLSFLSSDKTLKRKAREAYLAYQLEQEYTKEEIFEMYVNKVFMSDGINGIKAASEYYFNKSLSDLSLPEAAYIAGMPQSPNNYNAFDYPEKAEKRKDVVLSLMHQHNKISEAEMEEAQAQNITDFLVEEPVLKTGVAPEYDAFVDLVIEEVEEMGYNAYTDGLVIETTLNREAQEYMYTLLNSDEYISYPSELFQAGISLLDTKTGAVRAVGGGRNQGNVQRGLNYAADIKRQPGSTIKPILDYGPAIEHLKWSTYTQVEDSPLQYSNTTQSVGNAGGSYAGMMSMRQAITRSKNTPAVRTLQEVGFENAYEFAGNLGITLENEYESYAIGSMDGKEGISPMQMAAAYAAFGNGGIYNEPFTVKKVTLQDGTEILNDTVTKPAMSDYTAYMMTDMLKSVMDYGTGTAANIPSLHVAGKTGTTNYTEEELAEYNFPSSASPDSWFVGYTPTFTASIWTGYESRTEYLSTESQQIAKQLFKNLMTEVSSQVDVTDFEKPDSVTELPIVKGSNPAVIAGNGTPESNITYELFIRGEQPKRTAPVEQPAENETENEPEEQPEPASGEVTGLSASADANGNISVSWGYSGEGNPSFSVSNGIETQSIGGFSTVFGGGQAGRTYAITVTAIVDGAAAGSSSTFVTVPGGAAEPAPETEPEPVQPEPEPQIPAPAPEPEPEPEPEPAPVQPEPEPAPVEPQPPAETPDGGTGTVNGNNGNGNGNANGNSGTGNASGGGNGAQAPEPAPEVDAEPAE